MASAYERCTFCPRLCRHVCPVALATGREAATPTAKMTAVWMAERGLLGTDLAGRAAALCVGCHACRDHCRDQVPVADLLGQARGRYLPMEPASDLPAPEGTAGWVAVECDDRVWAGALAETLGGEVGCLRTGNHLGHAWLDDPDQRSRIVSSLVRILDRRTAITSCSRCLSVLREADLPHLLLADLVPLEWPPDVLPSRVLGAPPGEVVPGFPVGLVGGGLASFYPSHAADVARWAVRRLPAPQVGTLDTATRVFLVEQGGNVVDPVDLLLQSSARQGVQDEP